jgi:hypothetical protein
MVRNYLIWRGTPGAEASGFSVHILAQAFLFHGIIGILLFSFIIGFFLGLGVRLVRNQNNLNRLLGTLILTFVIGSSEVFSEAWKLLCYWMIFLLILILYAKLFSIFSKK